jgi:predicted branched-subunit amino acid permease
MGKPAEKLLSTEYVSPTFANGLKSGIPIGLGYIFVSFTFGMTASLGGFTFFEALFMSMTNLTSAGQFAGMQLINLGTPYLEMIITVGIINIRYLLMSTALSQKIDANMPMIKRLIISFGVTDETFSVASVEVEKVTFNYFMGLLFFPYIGWTVGTLLGSLMDNLLNPSMQSAASIALYCMFIALVLPPFKHHKDIRFVVVITIIIRLIMTLVPILNQISSGYSIILSACIAAAMGGMIYKEEDSEVVHE